MWYKGQEVKILSSFENKCLIRLSENESGFLVKKSELSDSKEESLMRWNPYSLYDVMNFHHLKFGKQDLKICLKKVQEEANELVLALETIIDYMEHNPDLNDEMSELLLDHCQDEYADVIQAGACGFNLVDAMRRNFNKVGIRKYSDNFSHDKEKEND